MTTKKRQDTSRPNSGDATPKSQKEKKEHVRARRKNKKDASFGNKSANGSGDGADVEDTVEDAMGALAA